MGSSFSSPTRKPLFEENDIKFFTRLGFGSFGEVFEAEWRGESCAVKRLHEELFKYDNGQPDGILADFRRECEILRGLDHPNIVKLVETIFLEGKPPLLITELLNGDLEHFIKDSTTEPKVSFTDTVNIMHDVAEGLKYLHSRNPPFVHRDLASKNILLTSKKQAKIADLGLAKLFCGAYFTSPKPTTSPYAAPETFSRPTGKNTYEKPKYGVKIDIFSFGVVFLEAITGRLPSPDPLYSPYDRDGNLVPELRRRRKDIARLAPEDKRTPLVHRCLDNNSHNRPSAVEVTVLLDNLRRWLETRNRLARRGKISLKIAIVGKPFVGKTAVLKSDVDGNKSHMFLTEPTLGLGLERKTLEYKHKTIELVMVDTGGQEMYGRGGVTPVIMRDAHGAILVFDLNERQTFDELDGWRRMIDKYCSSDAIVILVGNKLDIAQETGRAIVSKDEAESYISKNSISRYFETSAKTGSNIELIFQTMVELIYEKLQLDSIQVKEHK